MSRTKKKRKPAQPRAGWSGMLRFGLVAFPVNAFNAHVADRGAVAFHKVHRDCGQRIHYQKQCPEHGDVENDEVVSAFEFTKGKYVEIEPDELDKLRSRAERALTLDTFVEPDAVDPIYFDGRMYYLTPDGESAREPYAVFLAALENQGKYAVGQVVLSGKQQVVLVRPHNDVLHMALLNYAAEMRGPTELQVKAARPRTSAKNIAMAELIIRHGIDDRFDFRRYKDRHLEKLKTLLERKKKLGDVIAPEVAEEEPEIVNLAEALEKSLAQKGRKASPRKRRRRAS